MEKQKNVTFLLIIFFVVISISLTHTKDSAAQTSSVNLLDKMHLWKHYNNAKIYQSESALVITILSNSLTDLYNRAILQTQLNVADNPQQFHLSYMAQSAKGNSTFLLEIVDVASKQTLWTTILKRTDIPNDAILILPKGLAKKQIEFRIGGLSQGQTDSTITIYKALVVPVTNFN